MSARRWMLATLWLLAALPAAAEPVDVLALPVRRQDGPVAPLRNVVRDGPAVVNLWATYCAPCRAEVPVLRRAAERWRSRGVRVVGVVIDLDDPARVAEAALRWGIDYETLWVPRAAEARLSGLVPEGLPATFLVGPRGVTRHDRLLREQELDRLVAALLGDPTPAPTP